MDWNIDLNTAWFLLIGVLLAGYAVLDGFDLGVGVLHLLARDEHQRRIGINAIGPVWDGNEVWLLTGGGALFAAFPVVYATVFSGLYLAFMLLLFALIFRAVSIEFRGKVDSPAWRRVWDWSFGLGSLTASILFGVAVGNILRGLPIDAAGQLHVSFVALLNPYALLIGVLTLVMFTMHGAAMLALKTEGDLHRRMTRWTVGAWAAFVVLYLAATAATVFAAPGLLANFRAWPILWVLPALLLPAIACVPLAAWKGRCLGAFLASALTILLMVALMGAGLYPRMVPSSVDPAHSLTIYNASSSPLTLTVMLTIALIGMPLVLVYSACVYRVFLGKVVLSDDSY